MRYRSLLALPLIVWLYAAILARLFAQWIHDPRSSYQIFVPAFALFVLWRERKKLKAIASAPSWSGLPLVGLGLLILIFGVLRGELFFSRVSLLILLAGLAILLEGWPFFRAVLFPWAFLILMIPSLILERFTLPLQLLTSKLATLLLLLTGVPVLRLGNMFVFNSLEGEVAIGSGCCSLLAVVTLAVIYGYLRDDRNWVRVVLAISAVPITVVASSFPIVVTGLLEQYADPKTAERFFHFSTGYQCFIASLIMLLILHGVISRIWKSSPRAKPAEQLHSSITSTSVGMKGWLLRFVVAAMLMAAAALFLLGR